jgi:hypothetical protein
MMPKLMTVERVMFKMGVPTAMVEERKTTKNCGDADYDSLASDASTGPGSSEGA